MAEHIGKYGEPWETDVYTVVGVGGSKCECVLQNYECVMTSAEDRAARIVACVNALSGVSDPAAFMEAVKGAMDALEKDAKTSHSGHGCFPQSQCGACKPLLQALASLRQHMQQEGRDD